MKESYLKLLELLKELTEKIVLVTIPPIQSMADSIQHWRTFEGFNNFILQQHNGRFNLLTRRMFDSLVLQANKFLCWILASIWLDILDFVVVKNILKSKSFSFIKEE